MPQLAFSASEEGPLCTEDPFLEGLFVSEGTATTIISHKQPWCESWWEWPWFYCLKHLVRDGPHFHDGGEGPGPGTAQICVWVPVLLLLAMQPWVGFFNTLSFSFFIYKVEMLDQPSPSWGICLGSSPSGCSRWVLSARPELPDLHGSFLNV